ncbi:hypothetical protein BH11PAT1_BH11PAT1_3180 [soil metagenome]
MYKTPLKKGFTLIELLVVIAIIGILAAVTLAAIDPFGQFKKARDAQRKSDLKQIQTALELYNQDVGSYPDAVLFDSPWGTYMQKVPQDPEGKSYYYRKTLSGAGYQLYTSLDRDNDPQGCAAIGSCDLSVTDCTGTVPSALCNYGVSSSNQSP